MLWTGVVLLLATLLLGFMIARVKLQQRQGEALPVYGQVADFSLTNQTGHATSMADLQGHVWVADIIFTRCPGPCARMTRQMKALQDALPKNSEAKLVSLTTDPDYDTPPILAEYAGKFGADSNRWVFLTGTKPEIAKLATDSLKLTAIEKKPEEREASNDLFIHSTISVIVDRKGRLRGVYETTGEGIDPEQVKAKLLADVQRLERSR